MLDQFVVFTLDQNRYALLFSAVERIVRAVEVSPLPGRPGIVIGVINMQGRIIPVLNVRKRFQLSEREVDLNDYFIIARTSKRSVAIVADTVPGLLPGSDVVVLSEKNLPGAQYVQGIVKLEDGMILIHDLDKFFSLDEERTLDEAMKKE